jgi:hypothetical protein
MKVQVGILLKSIDIFKSCLIYPIEPKSLNFPFHKVTVVNNVSLVGHFIREITLLKTHFRLFQ